MTIVILDAREAIELAFFAGWHRANVDHTRPPLHHAHNVDDLHADTAQLEAT